MDEFNSNKRFRSSHIILSSNNVGRAMTSVSKLIIFIFLPFFWEGLENVVLFNETFFFARCWIVCSIPIHEWIDNNSPRLA